MKNTWLLSTAWTYLVDHKRASNPLGLLALYVNHWSLCAYTGASSLAFLFPCDYIANMKDWGADIFFSLYHHSYLPSAVETVYTGNKYPYIPTHQIV